MLNSSFKIVSLVVVTLVVTLAVTFISIAGTVHAETRQTSGWVEKVSVGRPGIILRAKIDTGAKHSSIHAEHYKVISKDGKDWAQFSVTNKDGETKVVEKPITRIAQIKQKNNRPAKDRPVILLGICMGDVYKEVEVNLVDRANFNYPMLVGRSFLTGNFVVDSELTYILPPDCKSK